MHSLICAQCTKRIDGYTEIWYNIYASSCLGSKDITEGVKFMRNSATIVTKTLKWPVCLMLALLISLKALPVMST